MTEHEFHYTRYPALRAYIDRIGAEQLNFADALRHWEGRFHTITLEDRNLPVIAQKRVLKPKNDTCRAELEEAF